MARLFFALWPDDEVRARLAAAIAALPFPGGRPVPVRNLHLTLVFLGNVPEAAQKELTAGAAEVRGRSFDLTLNRAGGFTRTGVAWLAPEAVPPELAELVTELESLGRFAGREPETRPYAPHLTIARKCGRVAASGFIPVLWPVRDFALVESAPGRDGSEYRVLARWPLRGK
jgi:2'-5' RNA ligase